MAKAAPVSPLAPKSFPEIPAIDGVRFAAGAAGVRYAGRTDVMLALLDEGTEVAGVFTKSKCPSAPVDWCRARLESGKARALLVNSGNANAFTGKLGKEATKLSAKLLRDAAGISEKHIFLASTGVIGEPLDATKFEAVLPKLLKSAKGDAWLDAAKAIMTTDTFPKLSTRTARIDGVEVRVAGMAKGAGMIAPDMATMLSFVFTDAPIAADALQTLLSRSVQGSFNAITVDSDTSTSDTLLLFATGAAAARGAPRIERAADPRLDAFRAALDEVLLDLAHQVVRDGEGARKFVEIAVEGADSPRAAKRIALSIANSPLVKTAIAGEDANWGRVVMAVGKAGEKADRDRLAIWFGGVRVAHKGQRDPAYDEKQVSEIMKRAEIAVKVDLGIGSASARVWTCDLTKEYVAINGDYRS
jgi:glutamate N-acetyltransferase / amino-acid N-acetyltransferase